MVAVESAKNPGNNDCMVIPGRMHNGVVILEGETQLPEGAAVSVTFPAQLADELPIKKRRIEIPLIRTSEPGTVDLTNARIAEILDAEDASA